MKTITKISVQKAQSRYNLFLDDEFFSGISEETLIELDLKKGMQVDEEALEVILKEESRNKCFNYCLWLLSRQSYFGKAIADKLKQKEYSVEDIDYAIERLKQYNYIDDPKLAQAYVKDKKKFARKGPSYIAQALRMKGIDSEIITETLSENYSEEEAFENCMHAALKKIEGYRRKCADSYSVKNKMYTHLMQKGFKTNTISKVLEQITEETADEIL